LEKLSPARAGYYDQQETKEQQAEGADSWKWASEKACPTRFFIALDIC